MADRLLSQTSHIIFRKFALHTKLVTLFVLRDETFKNQLEAVSELRP